MRLEKVIKKFPQIKEIAKNFNDCGIKWAVAAGTAVYVYCGEDESSLDDFDIWVASESKEKVAEILGQTWQPQSSERHKAENITLGNLDIFINCRKYQEDKLLLDFLWTDLVDEHQRETTINGVSYKIIAPEDVYLLKFPNPREKDKEDIQKLKNTGLDNDFLQKRFKECNFTSI